MTRKSFVFLALIPFATAAQSTQAFAKTDYCQYSETNRSVEVHLFGETYGTQDDKKRFVSGVQSIYRSLKMGDRFKVILHQNGQMEDLEFCYPGCPKVSIFEQLTAKCSVEIAKKTRNQLKQKTSGYFSASIQTAGQPYQILDQLKTLDEYYTNREPVESYVFNSTVPYGVDVDSKASLDKAFVEMVQTGSLENVSLPDVKFVNINPSKSLRSLWDDLKLDGKKGLNFNIQTVVLD